MRLTYLFAFLMIFGACAKRTDTVARSTADSSAAGPAGAASAPPVFDARVDSIGSRDRIDIPRSEGITSIERDTTSKPMQIRVGEKVEEPEPDEFIALEREPTYDPASLHKNVLYPEIARLNGLEGTVVLRVLIEKNGAVGQIKVEKSDSPLFEKSAMEAVQKTKFTPAIQNGVPIRFWTTVRVDFRLE